THEERSAWSFASFQDGLDLCRRVLRRGATPAVLRLYDEVESIRNYDTNPGQNVVLVLDEGDPAIVGATMAVVAEEAAAIGADRLDDALVDHWLAKRNDVAALER